MRLVFSKSGGKLTIDGTYSISASIPMLRIKTGTRGRFNIAHTIPGGYAYDPTPFPNGEWQVTGYHRRDDKYVSPYFIETNATQKVKVWATTRLEDGKEMYDKETSREVTDGGYGIHFSPYPTTQGCIKIEDKSEATRLVDDYISPALKRHEVISLIVED